MISIHQKSVSGKSLKNYDFYSIFGGVEFLHLCVFSVYINFSILNQKYGQYVIPNRKSMSRLTQKHNLSATRPFFFQKKPWCQISAFWGSPQICPSMGTFVVKIPNVLLDCTFIARSLRMKIQSHQFHHTLYSYINDGICGPRTCCATVFQLKNSTFVGRIFHF